MLISVTYIWDIHQFHLSSWFLISNILSYWIPFCLWTFLSPPARIFSLSNNFSGRFLGSYVLGEEEKSLYVTMFSFCLQIMNQSDTYTTWVNSQLSKRDNSRHVKDLSTDLRDGVVFLQLVEVIGMLLCPLYFHFLS